MSECVYKKVEGIGHVAVAAKVSEFASAFPPGWIQLESLQITLSDIPQHYMIATTPTSLVVAFMGTKRWEDLLADANLLHTPVWAESAALAADASSIPAAHRGFLERARAIHVEQLYELAVSRGLRLVLCGHSLGGAVAKLCTLRLLRELPDWPRPRVRCIAFATPAVGNAALAEMVANAGWADHFASYYLPEDQLNGGLPRVESSSSVGSTASLASTGSGSLLGSAGSGSLLGTAGSGVWSPWTSSVDGSGGSGTPLARRSLSLPALLPVSRYHTFGEQWFITEDGALSPEQLERRQQRERASQQQPQPAEAPDGARGLFSHHRMLAYRQRHLDLVRSMCKRATAATGPADCPSEMSMDGAAEALASLEQLASSSNTNTAPPRGAGAGSAAHSTLIDSLVPRIAVHRASLRGILPCEPEPEAAEEAQPQPQTHQPQTRAHQAQTHQAQTQAHAAAGTEGHLVQPSASTPAMGAPATAATAGAAVSTVKGGSCAAAPATPEQPAHVPAAPETGMSTTTSTEVPSSEEEGEGVEVPADAAMPSRLLLRVTLPRSIAAGLLDGSLRGDAHLAVSARSDFHAVADVRVGVARHRVAILGTSPYAASLGDDGVIGVGPYGPAPRGYDRTRVTALQFSGSLLRTKSQRRGEQQQQLQQVAAGLAGAAGVAERAAEEAAAQLLAASSEPAAAGRIARLPLLAARKQRASALGSRQGASGAVTSGDAGTAGQQARVPPHGRATAGGSCWGSGDRIG
eukprot:XP_001696182.1 triacylglycerol lipase-like protein [Chlamydomonas reinhardtii]